MPAATLAPAGVLGDSGDCGSRGGVCGNSSCETFMPSLSSRVSERDRILARAAAKEKEKEKEIERERMTKNDRG